MAKICYDHKLDYSDVLLVPQNSSIVSRNDVNLISDVKYGLKGIPIISSNMDGVGTFDMCRALAKFEIFTALIKHYPLQELVDFFVEETASIFVEETASKYAIYSMGANPKDLDKY